VVQKFRAPQWYENVGNQVYYGGETLNIEDHMPGTNADRVNLRECIFTLPTGDEYADFYSSILVNDDPTSFGLNRLLFDAFEIWDKR
jgi:hypothetical protein